MSSVSVDGLATIMKRLTTLKKRGRTAVMRSSIRGGLNVIGKQMKRDLDPKVKLGRKAIKARFKKGKRKITAKVGVHVGRKGRGREVTVVRTASGRGVGIGANNIHWWVAGTKQRTTRTGANRGIMPAQQPGLARIAYAKSTGLIQAEMIKRGALQLKREVAKLKRIT